MYLIHLFSIFVRLCLYVHFTYSVFCNQINFSCLKKVCSLIVSMLLFKLFTVNEVFVCCKLCDLRDYRHMVTGFLQSLVTVPNYGKRLHLVSKRKSNLSKLQLLNFCPVLCVSVFVNTIKILICTAEWLMSL